MLGFAFIVMDVEMGIKMGITMGIMMGIKIALTPGGVTSARCSDKHLVNYFVEARACVRSSVRFWASGTHNGKHHRSRW